MYVDDCMTVSIGMQITFGGAKVKCKTEGAPRWPRPSTVPADDDSWQFLCIFEVFIDILSGLFVSWCPASTDASFSISDILLPCLIWINFVSASFSNTNQGSVPPGLDLAPIRRKDPRPESPSDCVLGSKSIKSRSTWTRKASCRLRVRRRSKDIHRAVQYCQRWLQQRHVAPWKPNQYQDRWNHG